MRKQLQRLFLCLIILALSTESSFCQKGAFMAYGSLNYSHNNKSGSQFSASPIGLGYFFNDHIVAGMNYGFNRVTNGESIKVNNQHEVGPFYSDSWSLGEHFFFIAQLDTHYLWGDNLNSDQSRHSYNGYLARLYPIVAVNLGHGWALKAKFCELSFQSTKEKDSNDGRNNNFIAGINGSTLGMGVSKNFFLYKK